jgi:hypothetical protein
MEIDDFEYEELTPDEVKEVLLGIRYIFINYPPEKFKEIICTFLIHHPAKIGYAGIKSKAYTSGQLCLIFSGLTGLDILPGFRFLLLTW